MAKAIAGCKTVAFRCLVCFKFQKGLRVSNFKVHNNGYYYKFKEVQQINLLLAIGGYTYSNLRILNAHVSAEGSCKLFRITIKVVQVLEFNKFRHIHEEPTKSAANQ
jgi:hypothetical protein